MGGTVAVSIRRQNGEVIKMARKTGSYGVMLYSRPFNTGEFDTAIDDYVGIFNEMKSDYQSGPPYRFPMSPAYGWCESLAPCGYGLVVIDIQNKKIHSMQGYENPGRFYAIECSYQADEKRVHDYDYLFKENKLWVYERDELKGKVHDVLGHDISHAKIKGLMKPSSVLQNTFKHIFKLKDPDSIGMLEFMPDSLKEFEIINYPESMEGLTQLAKNLTDNGFGFTQEETQDWLEFAESFLEEIDEDLPQEDDNTQREALCLAYKAKLVASLQSPKP